MTVIFLKRSLSLLSVQLLRPFPVPNTDLSISGAQLKLFTLPFNFNCRKLSQEVNRIKMATTAPSEQEVLGSSQRKSLERLELCLNNWLKPQLLGESWDNVGLLVGSGKYSKEEKMIRRILLCNDLLPAVLNEAIERKADLILAYHPPIFSGMKRIAYGDWKECLIAKCLAHDISVYSPHTTLDSVVGGINDRVLDAFRTGGNSGIRTEALIPSKFLESDGQALHFRFPDGLGLPKVMEKVPFQEFKNVLISVPVPEQEKCKLTVYGKPESLDGVQKAVSGVAPEVDFQREDNPKAPFGAGRSVELKEAVPLDDAVDALKTHMGLGYVQLAYAGKPEVKSAAVCVGSGASLLKPVAGQFDLLITGEMSHHDILHCVQAGSSVVLCNHCSSERHFLPDLAKVLRAVTGLEQVLVSEEDASPLRLVL